MKVSEMLKLTDDNWIQKPAGFRVRFQKREGGQWVNEYMPGLEDPPLESDVTAWRSAWKLFQASRPGEGELINLTVVDDQDEPVPNYANGKFETYNPREGITVATAPEPALETPTETTNDITEAPAEVDALGTEAQPSSEESDK